MAVLEASMSSKPRENAKKPAKNDKKQAKKVFLVAQELKLARVLAGNNKTARDRALKSLKKWFHNRSTTIPFTENDFLRLWKGLFYSMWMSDKPLVQEECAENIANLLHALPPESALLFYTSGMTILMNEWFGIDQLRLNKFLMFVRRLLRQALFVLKNQNWNKHSVMGFAQCLSETILNVQKQKPLGLLMHFIEIFMEELAKVSGGNLPPQLMTEFVLPFIKLLSFNDDPRISDHLRRHIFMHLIRQSDLGLEYDEKYKAWRKLGFPGTIDSMKKIVASDDEASGDDDEEEEDGEVVFDPRAGRVDVTLPQLKFHPKAISNALQTFKFAKNTTAKSRRCIDELSQHFKKMASGIYPLGVKQVQLASDDYDLSIRKAVNRLVKFDKKIKGKKNRKRKAQDADDIELRGGKRIKSNRGEIVEKIEKDLRKLKKRKISKTSDELPNKVRKKENEEMAVESIFQRNSGTWMVHKLPAPKASLEMSAAESQTNTPTRDDSRDNKDISETITELFPKIGWDSTSNGVVEAATQILKEKRLSLSTDLLKNPFASPNSTKKVKINTKLNKSQDVQEHHAQILSSPAIPYDASKKPTKPLLKGAAKSPINPFYNM